MQLRHLRYFVVLAEELHFGRAAERLHLAQPWLSQEVRKLEADLGAPLLERTTRRVSLTPAGAVFLPHALRVLAHVEESRAAVARIAEGEEGQLVIGFSGASTYGVLPTITRAFAERNPRIDLKLRGGYFSSEQLVLLADRSIDVALIRLPASVPGVTVEELREERLVVALPADHPLAGKATVRMKDLKETPFVTYPQERATPLHDALLHACHRAGFQPRIAQDAPDSHTLITLVGVGLGAALVPESLSAVALPGVSYCAVTPKVNVPIGLAWRDEPGQILVERFVETAREAAGAGAPGSA